MTNRTYKRGESVKLLSFKGIIDRVIVEDHGDVISITRADELALATKERRDPVSVGFRKGDIIPTESAR